MFQKLSTGILILVAVLLYSCKKEKVELPALSYNYFPTEKGRFVDYVVDSIYHAENDNNNDDSVYSYHFYIRDLIDSSFTDLQGRVNQVVLRYRKTDIAGNWELTDVWTQYLSATGAYRTEDNIRFHKLSFPIDENAVWNVNDGNTGDEEDAYYEYFHEPETINQVAFDSTLSVLQIDENNYVETLYGNEKYAAGVGLVYQVRKDLGKRNGIVVKGLDYKMQVIDFGKQ
ncbi:MAG: hypothetical protein U0X76_03365 [Bacteroidia bacterium]